MRIGPLTLATVLLAAPLQAGEPSLKSFTPPGPSLRDEPVAKAFSLTKAADFLDRAALDWQKTQDCFSCHSNLTYLYVRPMISAAAAAHQDIRHELEKMVTVRWKEKGPRWDAEVVVSAAALAFNDAQTTGKLHPVTRTALDRMWTVQKDHGGWSWYKCGLPPMEIDDHYGATLAAVAVGVAPEEYAKSDAAVKGMAKVRDYFKKHLPEQVHHKAMLLWAGSYVPDLVSEKERADWLKELRDLQLPDGGWSAAGFGNWKRADKKEQEPGVSDGYGTGFTVYVLRRAGVPASDPAVQKGVAWLKANQRESGRWFARSLTRDNRHYLTHVGSAFAVMALLSCEEK